MRELRVFQVGDVRAELRELTLREQYLGMLEGTPWLHRRLVLHTLDEPEPGRHVHDLDRIRADAAARVEEWLPRERVLARLTSGERLLECTTTTTPVRGDTTTTSALTGTSPWVAIVHV